MVQLHLQYNSTLLLWHFCFQSQGGAANKLGENFVRLFESKKFVMNYLVVLGCGFVSVWCL